MPWINNYNNNIVECEDMIIDMKLNEVYGITSGSVTSANDDINTMPNEVYGIAAVKDGHSTGVSSCQRCLAVKKE